MHGKWLRIPAALACLFAQTAMARNIFLTSGDFLNPVISTFSSDPLAFGISINGVSGAFKVLPSASPSKYFVISRSVNETVTVLEGRFPNLTVVRRLSFMQDANAAAITPDGRRLLVTGAAGVQIIDATNDTTLLMAGNIDVGTEPIDVATSIDSALAFVLSARSSRLTAIDLVTGRAAGTVQLPNVPNAVTVGPNGVVYVSAQGAVYEIDGYRMQIRATIPVSGQPGRLAFTPDGKYAIATAEPVTLARGAFLIDLARRVSTDTITAGVGFREVAIVDDRTAYAVGSNAGLYLLTIGTDGSMVSSPARFAGEQFGQVRQIAVTNELPRGKFMIVLTPSRVYRVELDTNTVTQDYSVTSFEGAISNVAPPTATGGFGSFQSYNASPIVAPGTSSQPLVIRVYNQLGQPLSGIPVAFSTTSPGVTILTPESTSNIEGYASTRVSIPASLTGSVDINASIAGGARNTRFTIAIGDPGLNPGTPGGGSGSTVRRGLQIAAGHGQVISEYFSTAFQEPLTVRLTDNEGLPITGSTIRWSLLQGSGNVNPPESQTDENGLARANFTASGVSTGPATPFMTNTLKAESVSTGQAVTFIVTTIPRLRDAPGSATAVLVTPNPIRVKAGTVTPGAIQARVGSTATSAAIPFVGMRVFIEGTDPLQAQPVECQGGYALSDTSGLVSCDLKVGSQVGTLPLFVLIGSTIQFRVSVEIEPGDPSRVVPQSGETQSGNPGTQLAPLVVRVTDAAGNSLGGVPVEWDIPLSFGVVSVQRTTDSTGRASATVTLGQQSGVFTVRARAGSGVATFTLTANAIASQLTKVSGDAQTSIVGTQFAQPVTVRVVDAQNQPLNGATVNFTVAGPATLGRSSVTTGPDGIAATTVTAGSVSGAVTITATSGSASAAFSLTVRLAGPVFTASDILDGAGYQPGVSPGSIAYIRGRGFATDVRGTVTPGTIVGPLPTQLANVEVLFNNIPSPIFGVSNINGEESVVVQVPFEVQPGPTTVTIRSAGGASTTVNNVNILPLKPGVYTFRDTNGNVYATATRPDGSYVTSANPARRGELIRVYATGLGQTSPATGTNRVGQVGQRVNANVIAGINNAGIRVVSAELQPGSVGLYVITVEIPAETATGMNQPFGFAVEGADGSAIFANGSALPIM